MLRNNHHMENQPIRIPKKRSRLTVLTWMGLTACQRSQVMKQADEALFLTKQNLKDLEEIIKEAENYAISSL